jgi:anaerobic selenocysteine-containing dehydrogenase
MRPRFPSVSGKVEAYSATLESFGQDPLPRWVDPTPRVAADEGDFPLRLVTGPREPVYVNSQFRRIPSVSRSRPEPLALLHPRAARTSGIADGERVVVVSPHGCATLRARVSDRVHPECVVVPGGWSEASANLLTDDATLDPVTGFPAFRSGICRVERDTRHSDC